MIQLVPVLKMMIIWMIQKEILLAVLPELVLFVDLSIKPLVLK